MRVVIADPPAYTPPYDRSLSAALARAGAEVELVTSRFRFGSVATPEGYAAHEWFYPLSSRMGGNRVRLAVKALDLRRELFGASDERVADSLVDYAWNLSDQRQHTAALHERRYRREWRSGA